jgi:hypothetical protein
MKRGILLLIAAILICASGLRAQGKFSGYMFGDYVYNVARDTAFSRANLPNSALTGAKDDKAFQFRRIYFTYDNDISEQFMARFRLEADQAALTSNARIGVMVKDAYLRWKNIFTGNDLFFGIQPTPAIDIVETAWGYRSLEKTIVDLRGIASSRDLGLALKGKTDDAGVFSYWALVGDGNGNSPETDKYNRYYLSALVKPVKNLQIMLYGDYTARANINDKFSTTVPKATLANGTMTYDAFIGYAEPDKYSVGVEGFMTSTANGLSTPSTYKSKPSMGISAWATVNFQPEFALVGRFDHYDPNSDSDYKGDARNYILAAFVWKPNKNVSIMPNVQIETYEAVPNGPSYDTSVNGRLTLYYVFL